MKKLQTTNGIVKIFTDNIEQSALDQVEEVANSVLGKEAHIRIMPDVHSGKGCTIGYTAHLTDKVCPFQIGVDIGCGMTWVRMPLHKDCLDLKLIDEIIRNNIPSGRAVNLTIEKSEIAIEDLYCYNELRNPNNYLEKSLGSLGGGNHFIEIDEDDAGLITLIVHSGSRNLGKQVCEIYQAKAVEHCSYNEERKAERERVIKELKEQGRQKEIAQALKDIDAKYEGKLKLPKDLCYIEGEDREKYLHDMRLCQKWASLNRFTILKRILTELAMKTIMTPDTLKYCEWHETIHNYIGDDNIVRKGAVSAYKDEIILIPMNMRDGCIIAKGKGNEDWNCSAPHGAGRIMSRNEARAKLSLEAYKDTMADIYTTSVCNDTIDEAPMAYKPMQEIIDNIKDTVEIVDIIKPIYNFKATE